jgi:glutamate N-acetyltransferase/amino-acid N-acetyltransferase
MATAVARQLGIRPIDVVVASTGIIGQPLPIAKICDGIERAATLLDTRGSPLAAEAILTTDTRPKEVAVRFRHGSGWVTLGGIAKGAGMVAPKMATLLAFLTTDAKIEAGLLQEVLSHWVSVTFNAMTVDGETSTNDMVVILANGASCGKVLQPNTSGFRRFSQALGWVCRHLVDELIRDGEGVGRIFRVKVTGADDDAIASSVARRVANSLLVKTMVAGRDPNWGRIAAAIGDAGVAIDPKSVEIRLGSTTVFKHGAPCRILRSRLLMEMDKPEVNIAIALGKGKGSKEMLAADLTEGYVRINARYTS